MPTTLADLADALQAVFTTEADDAARAARLIRHARKFTGATFVQTLVFGWLHQPDASLEDLCATAADLGVDVAPQSLDERLNERAADCLRRVLAAALNRLVEAGPADAALLRRFAGVYALDATSWALPAALATLFPGTGAGDRAAGTNQAALKVLLRLEVGTGALDALEVRPGRGNDLAAPLAWAPLPEGALLLDDLGFFDLERLQHYADQGVYFLSRLSGNTHVGHGGRCGHLAELLRRHAGDRLDLAVEVGAQARLPCRLLAVRVPAAVAEERRRRVRRSAQRHGRRLRAERLELCGWNVLITNAPAALIGPEEAWSLRRLRWQIEMSHPHYPSSDSLYHYRRAA